jgi:hypothetical protein
MKVEKIAKDSPEGQQAIARHNALVGYDIRNVWSDGTWQIARVDGRPEILANKAGLDSLDLSHSGVRED